MQEERFKNIDFLRFLGAIIIAYFHMISCGLSNFTECSLIINNIKVNASWGFFWVEFFFILSGFFLFKYTNFNIKFSTFFIKKFTRLLPPIIFAFLLFNVFSWFNLVNYQKHINIYVLLFLNNIGITSQQSMGNFHPLWFVSSLFWVFMFYFYLKNLITEKWFNFLIAIITFFSYVFITNTSWHPPVISLDLVNAGILRAFGGIGLGYFLAMLYNNTFIKISSVWSKLIITAIEFYFLFFVIQNTIFHRLNFPNITFFVIHFFCLIYLFLINKGYISNLFNNNFSVLLGRYSYSIFVTHIIIIDLVNKNIWLKNPTILTSHPFLNIFGVLIVCLIFGIITFHLVEKPIQIYLTERLKSRMAVERERERVILLFENYSKLRGAYA